MSERVLIVDGLNTFFRSWTSNPVTDNNGEPAGGLIGSLMSIGLAIRDLRATKVIVVFDGKGGSTKRRKIFSSYKAERKVPQRLNRQFDFESDADRQENMKKQIVNLVSYLELLPVKVISVDNVEADDVIAYITLNYFNNDEIFIMSSDKDFMQLVNDRVKVWQPTKKKIYDIDRVLDEYHIHPSNITINRILEGDVSDNIDGVKGFGPKRLAKLFPFLAENKKYTIEEIKEYAEQNKEKYKLFQKLLDNYDAVERNNRLMNLSLLDFSSRAKFKIQEFINEPAKQLNKMDILIKFSKDGLSHGFKNFPDWISKTFTNVKP
jgi:5'-3' exonuclease